MFKTNFQLSIFLSNLPLRSNFFKSGGWNKTKGPNYDEWKNFLKENFLNTEINRAKQIVENYPENLFLKIGNNNLEVQTVNIWEFNYPFSLKQIFDPPPALFMWGNNKILNETLNETLKIGVVGTRRVVNFIPYVIKEFVNTKIKYFEQLNIEHKKSFCLVSGFAHGVDRFAHLACLEEKKSNIAVLGSGIRFASPTGNLDLLNRALKEDIPFLLLSEFEPNLKATPFNFPRRNRIISGLVQELAVIQAPIKSGALISARYALEEGRDVVVFDHPLFDLWTGSNDGGRLLIEQGAEKIILNNFDNNIIKKPTYSYNPDPTQLNFFREQIIGKQNINSNYFIEK